MEIDRGLLRQAILNLVKNAFEAIRGRDFIRDKSRPSPPALQR